MEIRKKSETFEDLVVWQKAHKFVLMVYKFSENFPKQEIYGLTSQLRRESVSIPANIAEGFKKRTAKDKLRYYNIAQGSLAEVKYYLILSNDLSFGDTSELNSLLDEVNKLLTAYSKAILKQEG